MPRITLLPVCIAAAIGCAGGAASAVEVRMPSTPLVLEETAPAARESTWLTYNEVRCAAAGASGSARRKEMKIASLLHEANGRGERACKIARLQASLLSLQAEGDRSQAAADALEAFFGLAEQQAGAASIEPILRALAELEEYVAELVSRGLPVPTDESSLLRQQIDMRDARAQIQLAQTQLQVRLKLLLGIPSGDSRRLIADVALEIDDASIDVDEVVAEGLARRSDLAVLRLLAAALDEDTVDIVDAAVSQIDGGGAAGGGGTSRRGLFSWVKDNHCKLMNVRMRLSDLMAEKENAAAGEIRASVAALRAARERAALAEQKLQSWRGRADDLAAREDRPGFSPIELRNARIEVLRAEMERDRRAAAWQTEGVRLRRAMGRLTDGCR